MRIKLKIALVLSSFGVLLLLVGAIGYYYVYLLKTEARTILTHNHETLLFTERMLVSLDSMLSGDSAAIGRFEAELGRQERNITEPGEQELTRTLRAQFHASRAGGPDSSLRTPIQHTIFEIRKLNYASITRRNAAIGETSETAFRRLGFLLGIGLIISIVALYNAPGYIADPIRQLTESIREIAGRKYHLRLPVTSADEFGEVAAAFNRMAEQLYEYERSSLAQVLFEKNRAEAVLHSLKDPTLALDPGGKVLFANPGMLDLLGMAGEEAAGQPSESLAAHNDLLRHLLSESPALPVPVVSGGQERYYNLETAWIRSGEQVLGKLLVLKNITAFRELDQAKTTFMATLSHELKTPLMAVDMSSKLLRDPRNGTLGPEQQRYIDTIEQNTRRGLHIINEILEMSRIESGSIQINPVLSAPGELVHKAIEAVRIFARDKSVALRPELIEPLPQIQADPHKLIWVLNNFLVNAIRYSPEGGTIRVQAHQVRTDVVLAVHDQGPGVQPEDQRRIFEKFTRRKDDQTAGGSGLGLAISKEFVEAMGGQIGLISQPGAGSTFWVSFPAQAGPAAGA
ncbi:MAG: ATP-binding protein [Bacteroidia bacterium]|nr:ATP-binding protein [Bacteroidia bacterium]